MTKLERSEKAQQHYKKIQQLYKKEIDNSIHNTTSYGPSHIERTKCAKVKHEVSLVAEDSVSCLFYNRVYGRVCILNFASYKNPGGAFLVGSFAQEEALCHESTLYPVLLNFNKTYYSWNKQHLNRAMYFDRALYSKDILFERNGKKMFADVLTCAAPNYRVGLKFQNVSLAENKNILRNRIEFMYGIAEQQEVNTLIAGAWGCGVFMQSPSTVCQLLTEALLAGQYRHLEKIYFAIPDENSRNFKDFEKTLNRRR